MPKTRIPSPARSQGAIRTPKRKKPRSSRSLCSPALSTASGRLTSLLDQFKDKNMDSFALSPLNGRSVLNDNTEIDEPRRKSWWKKLDENSQDVIEVLEDNKLTDVNNAIEEFIDIEVLSQEKKNYTLELPDSSDNESINSIILPQRKLFTQKENQPQKKFGQLIGNRESLAKLHKTNVTNNDKTVNVGTRELFQNTKRSKPIFPAALLNISPTKTTADTAKENIVPEPKAQVRNIFGNRPANKRKNIFADFIVSESEDEIPEIQPKVFGFQKKLEQRRISSVSKGRDGSPMSSITTDMEMDDWKLLPSSTMVETQLEEMVAGHTPVKRARLSKLSEAKESDAGTNTLQSNTTVDKTKQSNKSVSSKNKSKNTPDVKDRSLNNSRTTRSMLKNASKHEENTVKQDSKGNKYHNKISSKNNASPSKQEEVEIHITPNKSLKQNKSKTKNSPKSDENEIEPNEDIVVKAISNETRVISKSIKKKLSNSAVSNKSQKTNQIDKTATNDVDQNNQEDEDNFTLKYENDKEIVEEADIFSKKNTIKNRNTYVIEQDDQVPNTSKSNKSNLNDKSLHKEPKPVKTVEESVESQNELSSDDKVDGNVEKESEIEHNSLEAIAEEADRNVSNENGKSVGEAINEDEANKSLGNLNNKSQQKNHLSRETDNKMDEEEDEVGVHERDDKQDESQEVEAEDDCHQEIENPEMSQKLEESRESQEKEEVNEIVEDNVPNEDNDEEEPANESAASEVSANDSQEVQNETEVEDNESEAENNEDEVNESKANESEVDANESLVEANESEVEANEIEGEANESEGEANESEGEANESEVEAKESEGEANESEGESNESEVEANESEVEANESEVEANESEVEANESEAEGNESEIEDNQQMDDSDEADKAIASDPEISEQDDEQADEMEVDDDDEMQLETEASQSQEVGRTEEQGEIEPSTEEIEESPNVTHDTTGRNRNKQLNKSPEAILNNRTNQMDSFTAKGRNTSVRKTKSMIKNLNIRPSLAPPRDSTGFSDGTRNSSAEGSGWDSHRTTRKTLRQTFGKDFTPRKSLRALVMEKSAKRRTELDLQSETVKYPQANSTELPEDSNRDIDDVGESDHEVSIRTRQTTLEMYLQKIKEQNIEKKLKMEEAVRNSLKVPVKDSLNLFKVPTKPAPRRPKPAQSKPKKQTKSIIPFNALPSEVIEDMKYRPPKRFQPTNASWITKRLYKFLENKLEPKYDYKARVRAEKLVETVYHFVKDLRRHDVAPTDAVEVLKHELARLDVVNTHFEFYEFFHDFMPREVRVKVVPDIVNKIPLPRHGVFSEILRGKTVQG